MSIIKEVNLTNSEVKDEIPVTNADEKKEPERIYGVATVLLKAKRQPSYDAETLKIIFPGERMQILGKTESGKYYEVKVRAYETHGFVNAKYVRILEEEE